MYSSSVYYSSGSRLSDKGGRGGGSHLDPEIGEGGHPDPEIGLGGGLNFFWPFGPQFGLK